MNMGVWGEGPFDNDTAGDMVAALVQHVRKVVDAKTDARAEDFYYEARVASRFMLVAHGTDILGGPDLSVALEALARMRKDVDWLSGYKQPKKIAKALEIEIGEIFSRMCVCKGCRRSHDMDDLKKVVDEAFKTKVPKPTFGTLKIRVVRRKERVRVGNRTVKRWVESKLFVKPHAPETSHSDSKEASEPTMSVRLPIIVSCDVEKCLPIRLIPRPPRGRGETWPTRKTSRFSSLNVQSQQKRAS
jgi:hypothetical protein